MLHLHAPISCAAWCRREAVRSLPGDPFLHAASCRTWKASAMPARRPARTHVGDAEIRLDADAGGALWSRGCWPAAQQKSLASQQALRVRGRFYRPRGHSQPGRFVALRMTAGPTKALVSRSDRCCRLWHKCRARASPPAGAMRAAGAARPVICPSPARYRWPSPWRQKILARIDLRSCTAWRTSLRSPRIRAWLLAPLEISGGGQVGAWGRGR